jgi:uncharacterized integral membrane protein
MKEKKIYVLVVFALFLVFSVSFQKNTNFKFLFNVFSFSHAIFKIVDFSYRVDVFFKPFKKIKIK